MSQCGPLLFLKGLVFDNDDDDDDDDDFYHVTFFFPQVNTWVGSLVSKQTTEMALWSESGGDQQPQVSPRPSSRPSRSPHRPQGPMVLKTVALLRDFSKK